MKRLYFYLLAGRQLFDLLRKYAKCVTTKQSEIVSNDRPEQNDVVLEPYRISICGLSINRFPLQPQTVNAQWKHVANDPARIRSTEYKKLPRVE